MSTVTSSTAASSTAASTTTSSSSTTSNSNSSLGKNDFLSLLMTELQYQDPTSPMDTATILQQTSQLATLEASDNTNTALTSLTTSLQASQQLSTISAIGKTADLGDDTVTSTGDGSAVTFPMYLPTNISSGTATITDSSGNVVNTISIGANNQGTYNFSWNGADTSGKTVAAGQYHVSATFTDTNGTSGSTKVGVYPVDSVQFNGTTALLGIGANYVPLSSVKTIY